MSNYFSKVLLAIVIASFIYFAVELSSFITDRWATDGVMTFIGLGCLIIYSAYSSNELKGK